MNAEFLEKDIVIYFTTGTEGQRQYTAKTIRKNLAPISFIGAIAVTEDGLEAYFIRKATLHYNSKGIATVQIQAGPYPLFYFPATGVFHLSTIY